MSCKRCEQWERDYVFLLKSRERTIDRLKALLKRWLSGYYVRPIMILERDTQRLLTELMGEINDDKAASEISGPGYSVAERHIAHLEQQLREARRLLERVLQTQSIKSYCTLEYQICAWLERNKEE